MQQIKPSPNSRKDIWNSNKTILLNVFLYKPASYQIDPYRYRKAMNQLEDYIYLGRNNVEGSIYLSIGRDYISNCIIIPKKLELNGVNGVPYEVYYQNNLNGLITYTFKKRGSTVSIYEYQPQEVESTETNYNYNVSVNWKDVLGDVLIIGGIVVAIILIPETGGASLGFLAFA